jgi:membrane associated rhomboid family serine protease
MIPLSDVSRRTGRVPIVTISIIGLNAVMFILELIGGDGFINQWALVPADIVAGQNLITIFTSMFMHAGWEHIIGNMVFFWAFGPQVEDAMGSVRYVIFYLLGGVAATCAQILVDPTSTVINLGASGAIAAVMGAFLVMYPTDQIRTIVVFRWSYDVTLVPAIVMIGLWFISQLFSGIGAIVEVQSDGVAYMAHIGGFVFGAVSCWLLERPRERAVGQQERW